MGVRWDEYSTSVLEPSSTRSTKVRGISLAYLLYSTKMYIDPILQLAYHYIIASLSGFVRLRQLIFDIIPVHKNIMSVIILRIEERCLPDLESFA